MNATKPMNPMNSGRPTFRTGDERTEDSLGKTLGWSIAFHVVLFIVFAVRAVFFTSEPLVLENSIRVDIVSLPEKGAQKVLPAPEAAVPSKPESKPEPPKPEPVKPEPAKEVAKPEPPKPAPQVEIKKPDTTAVNLNKTKKDQESALKRLEALAKLEKSMKSSSSAPTTSTTKASNDTSPTQLVKGNQVSAGSSLTGVARLEHQSYLRDAYARVKSHWNLPRWLSNANLSAKVRLHVDESGHIIKKEFTRPSGNEVFDEKVMAAIEASSPLPAPPSSLANRLSIEGLELEFTPE